MGKGIFRIQHSPDALTIILGAHLANIDRVCLLATEFLESRFPHASDQHFALNLVLREGLTNAVRHGGRGDPKEEIHCRMEHHPPHHLKITVTDPGPGFDWETQRTQKPIPTKESGRGLTIMETYFPGYRYNDRGNTLYLEKNLPPDV